jgi:hypothetical protein
VTYNNNPVERLYDIVLAFSEERGSFKYVVSKFFNVDQEDKAAIYSVLIDLVVLARDSLNQIESIPGLSDLYIEPVRTVQRAILDLSIESNLYNFHSVVNDKVIYGLGFSCDVVRREFKQITISQEEVEILRQEVEGLIEKIIGSQLPSELKSVLLEKLEVIRKAFITIRITGVDGLKQALELSAGALFLNREEVIKNNEDSNVQGVISFMDKLNTFVSAANGVKELVGFAGSLLLGPSTIK